MHFEGNNHEEADNLVDPSCSSGVMSHYSDAQLVFLSPDTDVLALIVAN